MKKIFMLFLIATFLSVGIVGAVPPQSTQTSTNLDVGYNIFYPVYEYIPQNLDFDLHIHVSNKSNGLQIPNSAVECNIHLYNSTGKHTFEGVLEQDSNGWDFELDIDKGNFSDLGIHSFFMWCNDTGFGGEVRGEFEVTRTGYELESPQAFLYFLILMVLIGLFVLALVGGSKLEFKNIRNNDDEIIKVNWKKYLKIFSLLSSYMLLLAIVFVVWNLIYAYSDWYALSTFFHYIFRLLYIFALPVLVGFIVIGLANVFTDKKINAFIKRTGLPYNG